ASGFSQTTCVPARRQRVASSACVLFGVHTWTTSGLLSHSNRSSSANDRAAPVVSAACSALSGADPNAAAISAPALRAAAAWALAIIPPPSTATRSPSPGFSLSLVTAIPGPYRVGSRDGVGSHDAFVRGQRQERRKVVGESNLLEQLDGGVELLGGELFGQFRPDLTEGVPNPLPGDGLAVVEPDAVLHPLPQLGAGNLGGGGILHQVVDRSGTVAA